MLAHKVIHICRELLLQSFRARVRVVTQQLEECTCTQQKERSKHKAFMAHSTNNGVPCSHVLALSLPGSLWLSLSLLLSHPPLSLSHSRSLLLLPQRRRDPMVTNAVYISSRHCLGSSPKTSPERQEQTSDSDLHTNFPPVPSSGDRSAHLMSPASHECMSVRARAYNHANTCTCTCTCTYATCNARMDAWLLILFGKAQRQERQIGVAPPL